MRVVLRITMPTLLDYHRLNLNKFNIQHSVKKFVIHIKLLKFSHPPQEEKMFSFIHRFLMNLAAPFLRTVHEEVKMQRGHQVIEEAMCDGKSTVTLGEGRGCVNSNAEPKIYPQPHKFSRLQPLSLLLLIFSSCLDKSGL